MEIIDINIIEQINFMPLVGGWIATAISIGSSIFGGMSARRKARRRRRRVRKVANKNIARLKSQIGPVNAYYDSLDDMLLKDTETNVNRTVEDFTSNALAFNVKAEGAVESGKGLISGTVNKSVVDSKEQQVKEGSRTMDDLYANFERTGMELDQGRKRELNNIDDAIASMEMQIASL